MAQVVDYLFSKASKNKIPLAGTFELSPVCNFSCKMCYVRKTVEQVKKEGKRIRDWQEWLALAEECKKEGMLYLLLTGGEPFLYPNFKVLYQKLHEMGFILAINTNGTMITDETLEWLKTMAPSRMNITLYGASSETYQRVCGNPNGYECVKKTILKVKQAGIPVVINASMIPENSEDMKDIIEFGKKHGINTRVATYMFPPTKRTNEESDSRFSAKTSAIMSVMKQKYQFEEDEYYHGIEMQIKTLEQLECETEEWGSADQHMKCRAGRSSCWISWDGTMTACGMISFPLKVYPFEKSFKECWIELTDAVRKAVVLKECTNCPKKPICRPCVAMILSETGDVNQKSSYLCEIADEMIRFMREELKERISYE